MEHKDLLKKGIEAVMKSMPAVREIQKELTAELCMSKDDKSPVTVADFCSQAIICSTLNKAFPNIPIVGEESSRDLQNINPQMGEKVQKFINKFQKEHIYTTEDIYKTIDLGQGSPDSDIFWTLDPIDGTKGFLRGEQFSIALALIVNGRVKLGILGCPRLSYDGETAETGSLFFASDETDTEVYDEQSGETRTCSASDETDFTNMNFVQSYVSSHSNMEVQERIAQNLSIKNKPVQMDSQVKYGIVACGKADIYLRIPHPKTPDYKEKIWDHAAGSIIVERAGGLVTDAYGKKLDFSAGRTLKNNSGILASSRNSRSGVMAEIKKVL